MNTNILIIEDNPADIALIEAYLKDAALKHTLYKSDSLMDGLDFLKEYSVDLVLLDLKLVDVEGFKTLQLFREKAPDIPVIVLTGFKNEIMGIQSVRAGAQDFLVKGDFDSRSLARTIRYSLQRFETQIKLQEKAKQLSQNERRNQLAHQIARFGKWEMDIVNNAMKWDDEIFRFFGFPPHSFEPTLSDYLKYVQVEDREKVESFFEESIKDGQPHSIEHRIVIENTVVRYLQIKAQVNFDEQSNRIVLVGGVQDITEMKQGNGQEDLAAQPKDAAPAQLERDLISEFNFNVRTPIASLSSFIYLLEKSNLNNQQQDYLEGLKSSLDDLSFALNNWLNLSILKEGEIEVKLSKLVIDEVIQSLRNVSKIRSENSDIELFFDISTKLPPAIITDPQKFSQIIYNLTETAIRNANGGATIELSFSPKQQSKKKTTLQFRVSFESQAFSVEMANQALAESAEPDFQPLKKGGYLPIAISHKLAKALDGSLRVSRQGNKAVSLELELPVLLPEKKEVTIPDKPQAPLTILLVEDHDLHRLATKRMLTNWSELVSVELAENGKQAVEMAKKKDYNIILMDLQMPVLNGIEATIKIRSKSSTPVIALTANESKQEQERCTMVGMNDYIVKPIRPELLFSRIMRQLYSSRG